MNRGIAGKVLDFVACGVVASYVAVTFWNQYPHHSFNRMRGADPFSLIPNWRFFAPDPAGHDYHLFYRLVDQEGTATSWHLLEIVAARNPFQTLWFPGRRDEKAAFDLASDLLPIITGPMPDVATTAPAFRLMAASMRSRLSADHPPRYPGFQFSLVRDSGFDQESEPEVLFASPFITFGQ
ncbi:hypothetical protein [Arthrobacter sp. efr-133-R2A-120]|uniref:hypothetical protein n=1 Tax=Arthrobacter sp. efr-133-R2A-120 TaxID=3040277 RepID=UPI00254E5A59|nr:hypothetical protein [Arthrobacter sp. efr-133-R2A-120]